MECGRTPAPYPGIWAWVESFALPLPLSHQMQLTEFFLWAIVSDSLLDLSPLEKHFGKVSYIPFSPVPSDRHSRGPRLVPSTHLVQPLLALVFPLTTLSTDCWLLVVGMLSCF